MLAVALTQPEQSDALQSSVSQLLCSHLLGQTALPPLLGLSEPSYRRLLSLVFGDARHDDRLRASLLAEPDSAEELRHAPLRWDIRAVLLEGREDEIEDLGGLLLEGVVEEEEVASLLAAVVAAGCLASGHLWRALGLSSRQELRRLLSFAFPALVAQNTADMRWKRFFYRQLCEREGDYLCRAPTCGECSSYEECFVTEAPESERMPAAGRER